MSRARPADRLDQLIECAIAVFTQRGYRRTQMADIARAMSVAPGTLYLYVESKEALFDLVVQHGLVSDTTPPPRLPIPTPAAGTTLEHVRTHLSREVRLPQLRAAQRRRRPADARAEFEGVVRELYRDINRHRRGMKLLDRSALDWPDLAALYFKRMRRGLIAGLTAYIQRRMDEQCFRPLPDATAAARLIVETIAWFGMHRYDDPDPTLISDTVAEATVVTVLANAFINEPSPRRHRKPTGK